MERCDWFYIFEITEVEDINLGELISVEATPINFKKKNDGSYVKFISESKKDRYYFFYPKEKKYIDNILHIAKSDMGEWEVNFEEFNCKIIELDNIKTSAFYHKSINNKKSIWQSIKSFIKK
ncbi:hypothetical protein [uncultured Phocaeicola sp.]|uniref:hypothetical protein n=1 Tax=uncultured Phocaeicola sp. TaxID=990718 RepID=UPI0025E8B9AD|nr:hypothetical protein [uncultured Phocaeicola sp.]